MMVSRARTLRRGSAAIVVLTAFSTAAFAAGAPDFSDVVDQIHHGHAAEAYADLQRLAEIGDTRAQYSIRWRLQPAMEGNQTAEAIYPVTVDFGLSELIPREDK